MPNYFVTSRTNVLVKARKIIPMKQLEEKNTIGCAGYGCAEYDCASYGAKMLL